MNARTAASAPAALGEPSREIHLESLLGKRVHDTAGHSLGRIEEIIAEQRGVDWVVVEVLAGPGAMVARLLEISALLPFAGLLQRSVSRHRIGWHQLDLSDPDHPRTTVRHDEIEHLTSGSS
jgi:hypothetical protein